MFGPRPSSSPMPYIPTRSRKGKYAGKNTKTAASVHLSTSIHTHKTTPEQGSDSENNMGTRTSDRSTTESINIAPHECTIIEGLQGNIRMGTTNYFFKYVLPPIPSEFSIDRIYNLLIENKTLVKRGRSKKYTWNGILEKSVDAKGYKSLFLNIFTTIIGVAQETSPSPPGIIPTRFVPSTCTRNKYSKKDDSVRHDEYIYLQDPNDICPEEIEAKHLFNTAFSFHFKDSKRDAFDVSFNSICSARD